MKVSFLNLEREANFLLKNNNISKIIEDVIISGCYLFGKKNINLEEHLSEKFNSNAVLVGSGTDALYISLLSLGIGPGKKVAVPSISAIPTAIAVKMTGAEIKYVEVNIHNAIMNYLNLEKIIEDVDAVILVHLFGNVSNYCSCIKNKCSQLNIPLIEDCAQSFGAKFEKKLTGTIGKIGAFSFYPTKNLGTFGDGGMIITDDINLVQTIKELRFYGQKNKFSMSSKFGMNSRLDEIQSAILLEKLYNINKLEEKRLYMLNKYNKNLNTTKIKWSDGSMPHLYPIFVENRNLFIKNMKKYGVETAIHYPFTLPSIIEKINTNYNISEEICKNIVSIPFNPWMTEEEIDYTIEVTNMFS